MDNYPIHMDRVQPKTVVIIGGSISGLMQAIMLHRIGISVHVLEQSCSDKPESHMAGVCLGVDVQRFLQRFDRVSEVPLGISSSQLQSLDKHGKTRPFLKVNRLMSSWDALYYRLRANFDGFASDHIPVPPAIKCMPNEDESTSRSRAMYDIGKQVVDIKPSQAGNILVYYKDLGSGSGIDRISYIAADLVLGADGPNSIMRKTWLSSTETERMYAGYIAWRGVVPEERVSDSTRQIFKENITYSILGGEGGHVIVYNICGEAGSVEPGKRLLNFCWYTNVKGTTLEKIMTDVNGKRRHTKVPPGHVHPEVWERQKAYARTVFAEPYLEVLSHIASPFIHVVTDYYCPRASFANDRCLLVGDASGLVRPHIAFSTNQAAYQTLLTERLVKGEITAKQWEYQVTVAAHLHWRRSIWFGEYFQRPIYVSLGSAVRYWAAAFHASLRMLVGWLPKQTS